MNAALATLAAAALLSTGAYARAAQGTSSTVKDDLFAGTEKFAANASSVTEVDMDPDSLRDVRGDNSPRARRTVLSVVHTYEYDKPGMYNLADVEVFRNKLNTGDWHCSVHVRELKSGESTDVCKKHRNDDLEETAIITVEPKELTFIHTIRRPSSPGGHGGESSWNTFTVPPFGDGMPPQAFAAEMRVEGALMRAQMAEFKPEMAVQIAEMHAGMAGMQVHVPPVHVDMPPVHVDAPRVRVDVPPVPATPQAPQF